MKQKSLVKNVFYNFIYTGLNFLYPLITAPYVSRVLGATNLGKVNFATVVVSWFILFAVFGTATYGVREVAKVRDDKKALNKVFSEIFIINGGMSLVVTIVYLLAIINLGEFKSELPLFSIMALSVILNMFAIDWFFQGIEEYRYIMIRNTIIKVIALVCMFIFVNEADHYVMFGLISVLATGLGGVLNYLYSRRFLKLQFNDINPLRHIKHLWVFFFHTFIVSIYTNLDQILLGFLIDTKSVAFMNRTKAIVGMAVSISTAITNVTLPRASYYMKTDKFKFRKLLAEVPNYILLISIPIAIGCICLASNIMYLLGGAEFLEATFLLQVVALTIILSPLSSYLQYQVLVASGKEKFGLYAAAWTSILSLILNIILIPLIGLLGAAIVQVVAEITAVGIRYFYAKKKLQYSDIRFVNKSSISYFFVALPMGGLVSYIDYIINNMLVSFVVSTVLGGLFYIIVLLLIREKVAMQFFKKFKTRMDKG
ncbi:oligosaccharide flippase family protein [Psychrobacillus sp. NPDC093180]|uniref:oligosaccharide flippase family protein n=1 Tax=Psychrobacillus sp. NPDC093180 TaxID=3364489 RepID=UPI00381D3DFE